MVWLTVTVAVLGLGWLVVEPASALMTSPGRDFATLLHQACSGAALAAGSWLWLVATDVAVAAIRGPSPIGSGRRIGPLRAALLLACGVAALSGTTSAALAHEGPVSPPLPARVLDGLPMPDRATAAEPAAAPAPRQARPSTGATAVRVRPGDSLWTIAAARLGPGAPAADVASYWRRIHALNADLVGADPDLVLPGQQLRLPPA